MIRIKWKAPKKGEVSSTTFGEIRGHTVVLYKGRADALTEEHERAHIALGHYKREDDITPQRYWEREVDVHLYTYKRMGKPKRLITQLRGNFLLFVDEWGLSEDKALKVLRKGLRVKGVPEGWLKDLDKLGEELDGRSN